MCFLDFLKEFSSNYAGTLSALASLGALIVTILAYSFLKREFAAKYRPYVVPVIKIDSTGEENANIFYISIIPRNVGSHPCEIKLTKVVLCIGDEAYETPDNKEWVLLGSGDIETRMPAGHINSTGIQKIREARYKNNRIEINFIMSSRSIEKNFEQSKTICFEINVMGEQPFPVFMPDWHKNVMA